MSLDPVPFFLLSPSSSSQRPIDSFVGPFQISKHQDPRNHQFYTNFEIKMGSKYESKLTAAEWATFADTIIANVRARYPVSAEDEQEIRYQVLGRVQRDPAGWAPSNYNPYQQCLEDIKRIVEWKKDAASGHTWRDHMAAAQHGDLPPQFPLRGAVLASIGVLRHGQTRAYREAATKFDNQIRQVGIEFLVQGRAPNGFWTGLNMEVDFNKRPAGRLAKKHDLPRRPRYFMTRQQGIAHRDHVASTGKWLDPTRAPVPNPYLSPQASQGVAAQVPSGSAAVPVSAPASASASVPVPPPATVASGSKIPVLKRTTRQREDSASPEKPPSKASRPENASGQKAVSTPASHLPRPSQKKPVTSTGGKSSVVSKDPSKDKAREEDKAAPKRPSKEHVAKKTPTADDLGSRSQCVDKMKRLAAELEKSPAEASKSGAEKAQTKVQKKYKEVRFDPNVKVRVIDKQTPKKRSKVRDVEHPPGSQFHIPPFRKSSATAKKSEEKNEKAVESSASGTLPPAQSSAHEKSLECSEPSKVRSSEVVESPSVGSKDVESPNVSPGHDVTSEIGNGPDSAKEKQMEPGTIQGDGQVQMPPLTWLDILKPGNKLPNGVVIWDVRLLLGEWKQDDFLDFLYIVDDVYWSESEWILQESYFMQLAKAYPAGPKKLAKLVKDWDISGADDMKIDLDNDHPVSLAEKTYTRIMGEVYSEDEKEEFRAALESQE